MREPRLSNTQFAPGKKRTRLDLEIVRKQDVGKIRRRSSVNSLQFLIQAKKQSGFIVSTKHTLFVIGNPFCAGMITGGRWRHNHSDGDSSGDVVFR